MYTFLESQKSGKPEVAVNDKNKQGEWESSEDPTQIDWKTQGAQQVIQYPKSPTAVGSPESIQAIRNRDC